MNPTQTGYTILGRPGDILGSSGFDTVDFSNYSYAIGANLSFGYHWGYKLISIEKIIGTRFDDGLGSHTPSTILAAGLGNDLYHVGNEQVTVGELPQQGTDVVHTWGINYELPANVENLVVREHGVISKGNALDNNIIGGIGADVIFGGDGADTLIGDDGKDSIYGDAGNDLISIGTGGTAFGGEGNDTIRATGFVYELHGNEGNDTITFESGKAFGSSGNDTINVNGTGIAFGGDGNDTLNGTGFFYELYGEDGDDTLVLQTSGSADGGDGGDAYHVRSNSIAYIKDSGMSGVDTLRLDSIGSYQDLSLIRQGDDLFLSSYSSNHSTGVVLQDWYAGFASIENVFLADGSRLPLYDFA